MCCFTHLFNESHIYSCITSVFGMHVCMIISRQDMTEKYVYLFIYGEYDND